MRGFPFLAGLVGSVQENIFLNGHFFSSAGISKQSMGARNQEGIGLSYRPARLHSLAELVLKKPDGSWRPCDDFHRLNNLTVPDTYPLPSKMDFSARVTGCKFFSKNQFSDDIPKTAIITPFGLFEFLRLPFGLRNARSTFEGMMDWVLAELPIVFAYQDDIVVASKSLEQHEKDVEEVFPSPLVCWPGQQWREVRVCSPGSPVSWPSCHSRGDSATSGKGGRSARPSQAFYGQVNAGIPWGGEFLPPFCASNSQNSAATHGLAEGGLKATAAVAWTPEMEKAFADAKAALCKTALLAHSQQGLELALLL